MLGKLATARALTLHGFSGAPTGASRVALRRFIQEHDVRIVLAEFGPTGAALQTLCHELDIPLVVNFHGFDATVMPRSPFVRHAYRRLAREAQAIIGGSEHFRDRLIGLGFAARDVHVVPCGIDLESFSSGTARNGRRLIAIGG